MNNKYLFVNGTSISHAGGFEPYNIRKEIRDAYIEKGIKLPESQLECSYGFHLSKSLNLDLIDYSKSGSGIDRLVRTTSDWILENQEKIDKTIFILEVMNGLRLDWYVKEWNDYGVCNASLNEKGEYPFTLVHTWFEDDKEEQNKWNEKYYESITSWFNNFFDLNEHFKNETKKLLFFISYLKEKNIDFIISYPDFIDPIIQKEFESILEEKHTLKNILDDYTSIWGFANKKNILICNEIESTDFHLGYYGNKIIAEKLERKIKMKTVI